MEAPPPEPGPPKPARVFLDPEIIELHLRDGVPVDKEKARMIWLMNQVLNNPETTDGGW